MEKKPFGPSSPEAPRGSGDDDKPSKEKSKKSFSAPVEAPKLATESKKQKAEQDIARSITQLFEKSAETATEAEAPLETLTDEETQQAQQEIARDHLQAIEQADAETQAELEPATDFLERVSEGVDAETAFREAASQAGLSEEEIELVLVEPSAELPDDESPEADEEPADTELSANETVINPAETTDGEVPLPAVAPPAPPSGSGGSGRGTPPPAGPAAGASGPVGSAAPAAPQSTAVNPNRLPPAASNHYERNRAAAGQLLLVGIVGYLIGRRRGRIKTEKRLLPVQRNLEKQVAQLEQDITFKEQQLVAAKARFTERTKPVNPLVERTQPGRQETRLGLEKPVRVERLGQMVVAAEAPKIATKKQERPRSIREAFKPEQVRTMRRNELLELSEKIAVEDTNLRRIYESHLLGETQLRHLVSEYLQGKDIHKDLRREMVEHEIDFERDPILRDRIHGQLQQEGGGLGRLLQRAGVVEDKTDAALEHRVAADKAKQAAKEQRLQRQRATADIAMATVIVVLAIVVVVLVLNR